LNDLQALIIFYEVDDNPEVHIVYYVIFIYYVAYSFIYLWTKYEAKVSNISFNVSIIAFNVICEYINFIWIYEN